MFRTLIIVLIAPSVTFATLPQIDGPMVHVGVFFDGSSVQLTPPSSSGLSLTNFSESYDTPADVLDGKAYSSQYGFLPNPAFAPPANTGVWIEMISATSGLEVFEGGMRPMLASHTYDAIFGTSGSPSIWQWNGNMHHPWFAASALGDYEATFKVYIGDLAGVELGQYASDTVTLTWQFVPEPASLGLMAVALFMLPRRRAVREGRVGCDD